VIAELTIDLGAIVRNARNLAALVAPARLAAVVKADAYGHGLVPVARALAPHVDRFCVYALEDAVALRDAGLETPIHVLGPVPASDLDVAHAADVALTLWDDGTYARQAASVARRRRRPFAIQAKIDTGVARLGLPYATAAKAVAAYAATPEFVLRGAFTHFAAAEELDSSFTDEQLARFLAATRELAAGIERHAAATAAAMLWPQTRLDLVRAGIGLYGIWPSAETQTTMRDRGLSLEPALTWRTRIVAEHEVEAGASVGYGRSWRAARATRVGTLPIGYAEGLPRNAGGAATALVRGQRVPLIGRVCMDMTFIDLTGVPDAVAGDTVTLIGRDGGAAISADELGTACGTIGYEIVARLPTGVPRRYEGAAG
jgi:alanine racemase